MVLTIPYSILTSRINCCHRLFIVDGIISLPIALTGFWLLPDVPEIAKPWYLTKKVYSAHFSVGFLSLFV
jgi:hypothetical protein